jgi:hypothetical protein
VYQDLYFGETFTIEGNERVVTFNIPMDPLATDWNQTAKRERNLMHYITRNRALWDAIFSLLFVVGFVASIVITYYYPVWWNIAMVVLYVIFTILRLIGKGPVRPGVITKGGVPLAYAIVRVWSSALHQEIAHKITNTRGEYYVLVPHGDYYITVEQKNADGTYTKIYTSGEVQAKGVIQASIAF